MEEIPQASSDFNKEWMFPEREIIISDTILGKGAFGEVRVAKWRNINVAAKRLHGLIIEQENELYDQQLQSHNLEILNLFREEMLTLSKLRHPNLVLFLGIGYSSNYRQPTTILTELLSYSLYDLLETHKIQLTLPEIIDISLDIACGLDYLHSNNPSIIHRDISSKNILIGGNHAKIADLGQAKIFGSTALSRQTAMPGAMAYSAPEVLTGKYTTKIDIFSYGILLIQMCCNEYPRLDRRDEQYKAAISKFDPLHTLITETIEYQPNNRPTASKICEILKEIRNNDRYYPPTRRIPPQCDISIHARRWLEETVEERCGDIRIALEQTSRRVHIEEQRWRDEAERVDKIYQELNHLRQQVGVYDQTLTNKNHEIAQLNREIHQLKRENDQKSLEIQSLLTEKDHLNQLNQDLTHRLHDMEVLLSVQKHEKKAFEIDLEEMKSQLLQARQHENTAKSSESQVKYQLTLQMDHCQELETRLEQILSRWKHEKEQVKLETIRCTKLRETCAELVEKDQRRKEEIDRLTSRLNMYNTLPLPDEIKARFADNEKDIERLSELTETLRLEKQQMGQRLVALQDENEKFQQELAEEKQNYLQITKQMAVKDERIRHLEVMVNELDEEMQRKMKEISGLEQDKKNLKEITENIREQLSAAKDEVHAANAARRRAELDAQKRGEGSDRGKRYGRVSSQKRAAKAPVLEEEGEESYSDDSDEEEEKGGRQKQRQGGERKNSDGEEEEDDEDEENESRDIFNIDSPSSPSNQRPLSSSANGLDEIFDPDTRTRILHDQEKLRRYSIATRLKKVKSGELGTAELNAIKENTATRFHSYGSGNFTDLVKSASSTHDHLLKLQESRQIGDQEDPYERQREQDMHAKARILSAGERGGAKKIIECIWEHLDVS